MKINIADTDLDRTYHILEELIPLNITRLEETLNQFIKDDDRDIIIDLENVNKIDSLAMALFIRLKKKLEEKKRTLLVINPNESIIRVLKLSDLDEFLLE